MNWYYAAGHDGLHEGSGTIVDQQVRIRWLQPPDETEGR